MKKILISLMLIVLVISFETTAFAATTTDEVIQDKENEDEQIEKLNAEIKLTTGTNIEQDMKTVELILSVGKITGDISDLIQCGIEANLEYNEEVITNVQATKLDTTNIASVTCVNKRLLVEMTGIKENTDLIKLTLTLKEGLEPSTISFKLTDITFTKNGEGNQEDNQVTNSTLTANITIKEPQVVEPEQPSETPDDEKQDPVVKDPVTQEPTEQQPNKQPIEEKPSGEKPAEEQPKEETKDTSIAENELPKTGLGTIALVVIAVLAIGAVCLVKYKSIEVKPN